MTYVWKLGITADQEVLELFGKALPCKMNPTPGAVFHKAVPPSHLSVLYKPGVNELSTYGDVSHIEYYGCLFLVPWNRRKRQI